MDYSPRLPSKAHNPVMHDSVGLVLSLTHHSHKLVIQNEINGAEHLKEPSPSHCLFNHPVHHLDPTLLCQNLKHGHKGLIKNGAKL